MSKNNILFKLKEIGSDTEGALARFMGDEELYVECLESFVDDDNIVKLQSSLDKKRYKDMFNYAHTIKGVAANLGLTTLYNATCILVEKLRNDNYDSVEEDYKIMKNEFDIFISIINK